MEEFSKNIDKVLTGSYKREAFKTTYNKVKGKLKIKKLQNGNEIERLILANDEDMID